VEYIAPNLAEDFYIPHDMESIRKQLAEQSKTGVVTTPPPTPPRLRFQSAPTTKPYRPWDNKSDRLTGQVKVVTEIADNKSKKHDIINNYVNYCYIFAAIH